MDSFTGKPIPTDFMPIAEFVKNLPGRKSSATHELVFLASQLPPLGSKSYYIEPTMLRDKSKFRGLPPNKTKTPVKVRRRLSDKDASTTENSISNEVLKKLRRRNLRS